MAEGSRHRLAGVKPRPVARGGAAMDPRPAPGPQRSFGHGRIAVKPGPDGRTRLENLHQKANAKIRVPRQHAPRLEAVLINTAGGLTGGDRLDWRLEAGRDTHLVAATQACERIYKSGGGAARQTTEITVGEGARLDWLPQETILFDRSALTRRIEVDLAETSRFVGLETLVLGRAAMGETVAETALRDRWRIRRNGTLFHADDLRLAGDPSPLAGRPALLAGCRAFATIVFCAPLDDEACRRLAGGLREALAPAVGGGVRAGVSAFGGKCVVRLSASDSHILRPPVIAALAMLRQGVPLPAVWRG